jgi:penicillin-binding protein 2
MANMMAAIANEGYYITPHLNKSDSMLLRRHETSVSPEHFSVVKEGMCRVFEYGTGRWHKIEGVEMGGKTGTAQNPHGDDHSLFIGFAPKDNPQIVVAVVVENAGFGATWAAPIASLMIEQYLFGEIKRSQVYDKMCNTSTNSNVTKRP